MDLMLSGGEVKLFFPALLARQLLSTDRPLVKCCDGALHLTYMPVLLLDCLLHPHSARFSPSFTRSEGPHSGSLEDSFCSNQSLSDMTVA